MTPYSAEATRAIALIDAAIKRANRVEVGVFGTVHMAPTSKEGARRLARVTKGAIPWRYAEGIVYLAEPGRAAQTA